MSNIIRFENDEPNMVTDLNLDQMVKAHYRRKNGEIVAVSITATNGEIFHFSKPSAAAKLYDLLRPTGWTKD